MKTSISVDIAACVNNGHVNVQGSDWLDAGDGRMELNLEADPAPAHWDLVLLPVCCLDPLLAMAARIVPVPTDGDVLVSLWPRADLFDENGREMGRSVVPGEIQREGGAIEIAGQIRQSAKRFGLGERVASVEVPCRMVVPRLDRIESS